MIATSHDQVESALRAECDRLGARFFIERVRGAGEEARRYEVVLDRWGQRPLSRAAVYALPCRLDDLLAHVRQMVCGAAKAAETER